MSLSTINERLDLVEELIDYPQLRQDIMTLLGQTFDSLRLVTKFTVGRGDADDLMELSKTIVTTSEISEVLDEHVASRNSILNEGDETVERRRRRCIPALRNRFELDQPLKLAQRIQDTIDEEGLSEYHRLEEDQAAEIEELAQDVLGREAGEEDLKAMPKRIQPRPHVIAPSFKSATDGRDDIWIMKRNANKTLIG